MIPSKIKAIAENSLCRPSIAWRTSLWRGSRFVGLLTSASEADFVRDAGFLAAGFLAAITPNASNGARMRSGIPPNYLHRIATKQRQTDYSASVPTISPVFVKTIDI